MSKENFLSVPYTILNNKELSDGDKLTLSLIYSFHKSKKEMYMSNTTLGIRLGISRTAASERVTKLERLGYIKCERTFLNNKQRRIIVPLRMVAEPNKVVGTPNSIVGQPNSISRETDQGLVGEVGSIIYPSLLDKSLDKLLDTHITLEELEGIDVNNLTPDQRGKYYQLKTHITKKLKQNEPAKI